MRFIQSVAELCVPLITEIFVEPNRLTVRVWEPMASKVGLVTSRPYSHEVSLIGTSEPSTTTVKTHSPIGGYQGDLGFIDAIALDPEVIRGNPRVYGDTWSDFGAWMFLLTTDTWKLLTPFNRHAETTVSKVDSEGFSTMSYALTKARMGHLVIGSLVVPWKHLPLQGSALLRINTFQGFELITNHELGSCVTYGSPEEIAPNHGKTITALHTHLPKFSIDCPASVEQDGWCDFHVTCSDTVDATLIVSANAGYTPKKRVGMTAGKAVVRACALGLDRGDLLDINIGVGHVSGLIKGKTLVK